MQRTGLITYIYTFSISPRVALGLVFSATLIYFLWMTAPESTWVNADHDGNNYVMGGKFLVLTHPTGAPLFNLLNWVLIRLPLPGSDYYQLAVWSAVASAATATLLFHMTKRLLAPGLFMASGVVVSQSTIVEAYALITLMMVFAYYLHTKERHSWKYVVLGLALAIHHLPGWVAVLFLADDYLNRRSLKNFFWIFLALPWYAYIPLANREPYLWTKGESFSAYLDYFGSQTGLIMGLAIVPPDNLWMRLHDFGILLITGFGAALPFLFIATVVRSYKKYWLLPALTWVFALYYFTMVTSNAYIYMVATMAFGALLVGRYPISTGPRTIIYGVILATMVWNVNHYDIGVNLDAELSAHNFYEQVRFLPADAVVYTGVSGWQRGAIWLYNYENEQQTGIVSVSALALSEEEKLEGLHQLKRGLNQGLLYRSVDTNAELKQAQLIPWRPTEDEMIRAVRLEEGG